MYSMVSRVNNKVSYTRKLLRASEASLPNTELPILTKRGDTCVNYLDFGSHSTVYMYINHHVV